MKTQKILSTTFLFVVALNNSLFGQESRSTSRQKPVTAPVRQQSQVSTKRQAQPARAVAIQIPQEKSPWFLERQKKINEFLGKKKPAVAYAILGEIFRKNPVLLSYIEISPALINNKDDEGTILHRAVKSRNTKLMNFLIEKGADPSIKDDDGQVPEFYAKNIKIKEILVKKGSAKKSFTQKSSR